MTDIEQKALALVNEVSDGFHDVTSLYDIHTAKALRSALCRAIEQNEAFRQEVSDKIEAARAAWPRSWSPFADTLDRFIIAKPDPLIEAWDEAMNADTYTEDRLSVFRAAIAKRSGRILWGEG